MEKQFKCFGFLAISFMLVCMPAISAAMVWTVDTTASAGGQPEPGNCQTGPQSTPFPCRLGDAIVAADDGDTIQFNLPASTTIAPVNGALELVDSITIDGANVAGGIVTIDGSSNGSYRIFTVTGRSVAIKNVVIKNASSVNGAAIYASSTSDARTLRVDNVTFSHNTATGRGGAIAAYGISLYITNSTFDYNSAPLYGYGGAVYGVSQSSIDVRNTVFSNNAAQLGGAIYSNSALNVSNGSFVHNESYSSGGAIYNRGGANIENSNFSHNSAEDHGGAIYSIGFSLTLIGSQFTNNLATQNGSSGGAVFATGRHLVMKACALKGNAAVDYGGAIYLNPDFEGYAFVGGSVIDGNEAATCGGICMNFYSGATTIAVVRSTITNNNATQGNGGGVYVVNMDQQQHAFIVNSTLYSNSATGTGGGVYFKSTGGDFSIVSTTLVGNGPISSIDVADTQRLTLTGSIVSGGCTGTLLQANYGNLESGDSCDFTSPNSMQNANLLLGSLQYNGGPTKSIMPGTGSDAIDFVYCETVPGYDQRSAIRPDGGSIGVMPRCDSGAVEVGGALMDRIFANSFQMFPFL